MAKMDIAESRWRRTAVSSSRPRTNRSMSGSRGYPSIYGEAMVMRLLDKSNIILSLGDIGFSDEN